MTIWPGLRRMLTQTASTKRETLAAGKFTPAAKLAEVKVSRLYPLDPEIQQRMALDTPHELLEVFAEPLDIQEGDILTVNGTDYPIRSCADWSQSRNRGFLRLVVEDLKS